MKNNIALMTVIIFGATNVYAKDSDVEARGPLVSLTESSVTVGSLTCVVTSGTEFKDESDASISPSAFTVGDNVKLVCRGTSAKELERKLTDDNTGGGNSGGNGGSGNGGSGNGGDGENGSKELEIKDTASKATGVNTGATGKVEYSYRKDKKGRTDIDLKTTVKVPVPSTVPLLSDVASASGLGLTVVFSRGASDLASCDLVFDSSRKLQGARPRAEYKLDIRSKRGSLSTKKGSCDTDLATDGIQSGIAELKKGDTYVISDSLAGIFLVGTL